MEKNQKTNLIINENEPIDDKLLLLQKEIKETK